MIHISFFFLRSLRDRVAKKEKERRLMETELITKEKEIREKDAELATLRLMLGSGFSDDASSMKTSLDQRIEAQLRNELRYHTHTIYYMIHRIH